MRKMVSLITALVLVLAMTTAVAASDFSSHPNQNPGVPSYTFDEITICIGHRANEGQWLRAQKDGYPNEYIRIATGTHDVTIYVFGRELLVRVHGNSLRWVRCAVDPGNVDPLVRVRSIRVVISETEVSELIAANADVRLYQVNRNHPGPVPLYLFGDNNGNVNFARVTGSLTVETTTTIAYRYIHFYSDGSRVKGPINICETITENVTTVDSGFVQYDAGSSSFTIEAGDLLLNLDVRGNTNLLDTSTVTYVGTANVPACFDLTVNSSWYRVMSGDQG
ncbi:MAG: hypothetical protein FWC32_13800 [Firmicutes bacterium]|nr:hypothetical protein [Bacillota bacterium]